MTPPVELTTTRRVRGDASAADARPLVLVAEDDRHMRELVAIVLRESALPMRVVTVDSALAAMDVLEDEAAAVVVTDLCMPGADGLELLRFVRAHQPLCQVLLVTGFASIDSAIAAIRDGAFDYVQKPFEGERLRALAESALNYHLALAASARASQGAAGSHPGDDSPLVGRSAAMQAIERLIEAAAAYDAGVLVSGESGVGKELVVRRIHQLGARRQRPFIAINCAAIPETLIESELFGYRRGAFTGADRHKPGMFELADGGTLFLDEITSAPAALQAKLLRVLQDGAFYPAGATEAVRVDVRVIAAANLPLRELVDRGEFRKDLYYRLSVMEIDIPPLRERRDDIVPLALHFLAKHSDRMGKPARGFSPAVLAALMRHDWPGNVRELENLVQRMLIMAARDLIDIDVLPAHLAGARGTEAQALDRLPPQSLEDMEAYLIRKTLRKTSGDRTLTARILGIDKSTLWRKVKRYGIEE